MAKSAKSTCSFASILREVKGLPTRDYMVVGVLTARHLLRVRKPFNDADVNVRGVRGDPRLARRRVGEFLDTWRRNGDGGARGAQELLAACPKLAAKAKKLWKGY
jgi:hypothetical protein